eukprot:3927288-Amphidinium_carterae.1
MYAEDSDFAASLKESAKGSECAITVYPDMTHGFTCRGDLADEKVARDVDAVFKQAAEFIGKGAPRLSLALISWPHSSIHLSMAPVSAVMTKGYSAI